jgi:hypothetical protein
VPNHVSPQQVGGDEHVVARARGEGFEHLDPADRARTRVGVGVQVEEHRLGDDVARAGQTLVRKQRVDARARGDEVNAALSVDPVVARTGRDDIVVVPGNDIVVEDAGARSDAEPLELAVVDTVAVAVGRDDPEGAVTVERAVNTRPVALV